MSTMAERERCPKHDVVLIERFEERGSLMIPTGEFCCLHCTRELTNNADTAGPSPTDAEFDAAIDAAYERLHEYRRSEGGVFMPRPARELAEALAELLALCGRGTDA